MSAISPAAERTACQVAVRRDVRIPTADPGCTLSADLFLPARVEPVPALVTVVPYRKDIGGGYEASYRWFAARGYACVLVDHAGVGSSDGMPHPPWGPLETDDAVAAAEWAAAQPWCTGDVGMWGTSHGGFTALGAASRGLPALKAVIAMENALDVERDIMHPDGARGDFLRLASWGGRMIVQQLLPPLLNYTSVDEQRRWRRRLQDTKPYILELACLGPGDPAWRDRVIEPASITVPVMCVGGWYDAYPDAVPRAYEQLAGPKKLLMGPWGHGLPQDSPHEPVDFLALALRWWDRWLRGVDNGVMDEPPVTLYLQGHDPGWRSYDSWPPGKDELVLATGTDITLAETVPDTGPRTEAIAEYQPDPTTGALSGLRGVGAGAIAGLLDQHDDDLRALHFTSDRLPADILLCGRPEVTIRLADEHPDDVAPQRLVVRLTDVDPHNRSTFITSGVRCPDTQMVIHQVTLAPAAYRIRAGHRLRVVVSDSDFPRLTPLPTPARIGVASIAVTAPTLPEDIGATVDMPTTERTVADRRADRGGCWTITRDPVHDDIEVAIATATDPARTEQGHLLATSSDTRASVRRNSPEAATITAAHTANVRLTTGETVTVSATVRCTQTALWARGDITIDGLTTYTRTWEAPLAPEVTARRPG